jgi:hypothetical protein
LSSLFSLKNGWTQRSLKHEAKLRVKNKNSKHSDVKLRLAFLASLRSAFFNENKEDNFLVTLSARANPRSERGQLIVPFNSAKNCQLVILFFSLLGITWALGVFLVNVETTFVAYLFTITNSLQGRNIAACEPWQISHARATAFQR